MAVVKYATPKRSGKLLGDDWITFEVVVKQIKSFGGVIVKIDMQIEIKNSRQKYFASMPRS